MRFKTDQASVARRRATFASQDRAFEGLVQYFSKHTIRYTWLCLLGSAVVALVFFGATFAAYHFLGTQIEEFADKEVGLFLVLAFLWLAIVLVIIAWFGMQAKTIQLYHYNIDKLRKRGAAPPKGMSLREWVAQGRPSSRRLRLLRRGQ